MIYKLIKNDLAMSCNTLHKRHFAKVKIKYACYICYVTNAINLISAHMCYPMYLHI